jgi:hypothetical protein
MIFLKKKQAHFAGAKWILSQWKSSIEIIVESCIHNKPKFETVGNVCRF